MRAYKGFDKDMKCRGFQYEVGKTYELPEGEEAKLCRNGFHACEDPLDCLRYYDIIDGEVHEVEIDGLSAERSKEDTKLCAKKITVGAKLDIKGIVSASIDFVMNSVKKGKNTAKDSAKLASSGYYAKLASSGYSAQLDLQGKYSVGAAIGVGGQIRGKLGNWITLAEWKYNGEMRRWIPLIVKSGQIDGETLKPDVWYTLENGEWKEISDGDNENG